MSTITVDLTIKVKNKFTSSNAENIQWTEKIIICVLSGLKGGPTRGSKVFNTIIQMEAGHLRENPQTPQQQETLQAITSAAKG